MTKVLKCMFEINFEKYSINCSQKTGIEQFINLLLSLMKKPITLLLTISTYSSKIAENWDKNYGNFERKQRNSAECSQNPKISITPGKKYEIKKINQYFLVDELSNDITNYSHR